MNRNAILFTALGVAVMAILFVLIRPPATDPIVPGGTPADNRHQFRLVLQAGAPQGGFAVYRLTRGAEVSLVVESDTADELHLHGYDLSLPLRPGVPAKLEFVAQLTGRFEMELHGAHAEVGAFEIFPE